MKPLQNNFTTPEQSKRLLELGVPADSADCYYSRMRHEDFENPFICYESYSNHAAFHPKTFIYLPCWSVGRLIEIELICRAPQEGMIPRLSFIYGDSSENGLSSEYLIESLVTYLEIGQYNYDFSKLEDRK